MQSQDYFYHFSRKEVLREIKGIVQTWVTERIGQDLDPLADAVRFHFCVFGSIALEVQSKESDLDAIVVSPEKVAERDHFFEGSLVNVFQNHPEVTDFRVGSINYPFISN